MAVPEGPGILEIRVHGVHGTPPSAMLGTQDIGQVAGDKMTGFYRTRSGKLTDHELPANVSVEAYSWGTLTSGVGGFLGWLSRVGWLALLPFAMVNLAYWARTTLGENSRTSRMSARVVRTAALLLTLMLVLTPCLIGIDLISWQCYRGGVAGCPALPGVLDLMARDPVRTLQRRIALATLLPLGVVVVLWYLSGRSMARCEEIEVPSGQAQAVTTPILGRENMWAGGAAVARLRTLHLGFALLVIVLYSGAPVLHSAGASLWPPWQGSWTLAVLWVVVILACLLGITIMLAVGTLGPKDVEYVAPVATRWWTEWLRAPTTAKLLGRASAAIFAVHVAQLWLLPYPDHLDQSGNLYLYNAWFAATFIALTIVGTGAYFVERQHTASGFLRGTVLFLTPLLCFVAGLALLWQLLPQDGLHVGGRVLTPLSTSWAVRIWVVVLAIWAGLAFIHYKHDRTAPQNKAVAWGGAGVSVLLNGAAWVALLFTTAVVALAADRLNGDLGVTNIQTTYEAAQVGSDLDAARLLADPQALATASKVPPADTLNVYVLGKDVTLEGGTLDILYADPADPSGSPERVLIRSGRLTADSVERVLPGASGELKRISVRLGTVPVHDAYVVIPGDVLLLKDSCIRAGTAAKPPEDKAVPSCTVADPGFLASGTIAVPDAPTKVLTTTEGGSDPPEVQVSAREKPQTPLVLPQVLVWAPLAQLVWLPVVLLVSGVLLVRLRRYVRAAVDDAVATDAQIEPRYRPLCERARLNAAFVHRAETLVDWIGCFTVPIVLALLVFSSTGRPPWQVEPWLHAWSGLAMRAALGIALLLVLLLSQMRTKESLRKTVGILWDLTTFWPRAAHPLGPPCYAERVVPELVERTTWALRSEGSHVILSGHSQGSAVLMAVTHRLDDLARVRLITYGSQIRAWYGRIFPRVLGPDVIGNVPTTPPRFEDPQPDAVPVGAPSPPDATSLPALPGWNTTWGQANAGWWASPPAPPAPPPQAAAVPHWVNLFRKTDPIGFRVFSDHTSTWDVYVLEVPSKGAGDPTPLVQGHSAYPQTAAYRRAVEVWFHEVPPETELELWPPRLVIAKPTFADVDFFPDT